MIQIATYFNVGSEGRGGANSFELIIVPYPNYTPIIIRILHWYVAIQLLISYSIGVGSCEWTSVCWKENS